MRPSEKARKAFSDGLFPFPRHTAAAAFRPQTENIAARQRFCLPERLVRQYNTRLFSAARPPACPYPPFEFRPSRYRVSLEH
ncbi:hypothetical protein [Kingella potus]|uniref:hypothetical protein n=1 Tax=Kingella potus TaxID=265175 RepID=UPI001FD2073C|nr:hypothetical protein [Kingella potus]UOO99984.1 hypothetical protein LVJ84_08110 [Kingella potus]